MILKSNAIVLRCIDYSNTSQIATLFTDNQGKISTIAKGSKRQSKNSFPSSLGLLNAISVVYYQKSLGQLVILKEHNLKDHFWGIRQHLGKIFIALYWVELVRECTNEGEANQALFHTLQDGLSHLVHCSFPIHLFLHVHWRLLKFVGLAPHIENCLRCQLPVFRINISDKIFFSPQRGGILCPNCSRNIKGAGVTIPVRNFQKVLTLFNNENALDTDPIDDREYNEIYSLLRLYLHVALQKQLRLHRYLSDYHAIVGTKDSKRSV